MEATILNHMVALMHRFHPLSTTKKKKKMLVKNKEINDKKNKYHYILEKLTMFVACRRLYNA